jgi:tripartite-type tricarboxylate transporter receptor subunit TctC
MIRAGAGAGLLGLAAGAPRAQDAYPSKPLRCVVAFAAGGRER